MRELSRGMLWTVLAAGVMTAGAEAAVYNRICLLRGIEEVPANASTAVGCGTFEIDTCANTVRYRIVVSGLSAAETVAHIHGAADPGVNAGVVHPLAVGPIKTGVWNYAEAQESDILNGRMYVNVHSAAFPAGEVRGQIVTHVASIDAAQEVPANPSPAQGFGVFTINTDANVLRYYIGFGGLTAAETVAHIHGIANYGVNAGVLVGLPLGSPKVGAWTYPEALEQQLLDGLSYVNIHSAAFPGGEIRGQVVSSANPLDGQQEVPANASTTCGCALIAINRAADTLGFDVRRSAFGTAETVHHIHGFAAAGSNAGVLFGLPAGPRKLGSWAYAAAQETGIYDDERTYVNLHSTAFPGGEIRGQVRFPSLLPPPCVADTTDGAGGPPDGGVGIEDLLEYLSRYDAGSTTADVDDGTGGGCPDGGVGIEDLLYYLSRYDSGC